MSPGKTRTPDGRSYGLCVVGNLTIDLVLRDIAVMPAWGQEVVGSGRIEAVAGQAANMGLAAARLGVSTKVIANVGDDAAGARIRAELDAGGVGVSAVETTPGGATALTVAVVRPDGERAFLSDFGCLKDFGPAAIARHWSVARDAQVVALVGTSNLPNLDLHEVASLLAEARAYGALTVFDPGWDPDGWAPGTVTGVEAVLAQTDLFLPNQDEGSALTHESEPSKILRSLSVSCRGTVVIKAGSAGSYCMRDGQILHVDALATTVDNAVGAGDVYNAGVVAGHLRGGDVVHGMTLGTAAASVYVSRRASRFPTFDEISPLVGSIVVRTAGSKTI